VNKSTLVKPMFAASVWYLQVAHMRKQPEDGYSTAAHSRAILRNTLRLDSVHFMFQYEKKMLD